MVVPVLIPASEVTMMARFNRGTETASRCRKCRHSPSCAILGISEASYCLRQQSLMCMLPMGQRSVMTLTIFRFTVHFVCSRAKTLIIPISSYKYIVSSHGCHYYSSFLWIPGTKATYQPEERISVLSGPPFLF